MAQEFLNAAEQVLKQHNQPMLVKDIFHKALELQMLKTSGATPVNTMRARLAEHIRKNKDKSIFIRVRANKFALREWGQLTPYESKPFIKNTDNEITICISQKIVDKHKRFFGFRENFTPLLNELSKPENIILCHRAEAQQRTDIKQLVSYVLLKRDDQSLLSYVRGSYGQKDSLLQGVLCIGFGGHVNKTDYDLFGTKDGGVINSAYREIREEIKKLKIYNLNPLGIINDDSSSLGLNHLAIVFEAQTPADFDPNKASREMSINKLQFLNAENLWARFHELEFWSQLLVKQFIIRPSNISPVYIKTRNKKLVEGPIVIVGEIGSGKTEVSEYISNKHQIPLISTRKCVAKLINEKDFGSKNRLAFQDKAAKLIKSATGIQKLAEAIVSEVTLKQNAAIVVDGVRNLETYNLIKQALPNSILMYIDTPRDTAFQLYKKRDKDGKSTINDFRNERQHDVEKEIILFKTRADVYLFNGGNLRDLYKTINNWWREKY